MVIPEPTISLWPALLLFVGGPILIWRLRRRPASMGGMRVQSRTALSRNGVLAVVEIDGNRYLVGATDHQVSLLSQLETLPTEAAAEPRLRPGPRTSPIETLRRITARPPARRRPPRVTLS
jgi:flagellar biogenesis protein FliO